MVTPILSDELATYALIPDCRFDCCDPSVVVETDDKVFSFDGIDATLFTGILRRLDGTEAVGDIALALRVPSSVVQKVCTLLVDHFLAVQTENLDFASREPSSSFSQLCEELFPAWKARVFGHPLWRSLADGTAAHSVFAGWLLETYHFIETVNSRLVLAIAECRNFDARTLLLHHYVEEWDHHHFFMRSLNELGYGADNVLRTRPLPGTVAVINHMRDAARQDPLYYAACSGFLESTGEDRAGGREFFDRLIEHYCPKNPSVVLPMRAHLDLDEDYGHNGMLAQISSKLGHVTKERLEGALTSVVCLVETLELWSTDIQKTYSEFAPPLDGSFFWYRRCDISDN